MLLSYALMLVLMTFNGPLFLCVVLGYGAGYSLFGFDAIEVQFKPKNSVLINTASTPLI